MNLTIICNYTGIYYASIWAQTNAISYNFTLIISGIINIPIPPVPGFEILFIMFGFVMAMGLVMWLRKNKTKQVNII